MQCVLQGPGARCSVSCRALLQGAVCPAGPWCEVQTEGPEAGAKCKEQEQQMLDDGGSHGGQKLEPQPLQRGHCGCRCWRLWHSLSAMADRKGLSPRHSL